MSSNIVKLSFVAIIAVILIALFSASQPVNGWTPMNKNPIQVVLPFYTECLTANNHTSMEELAGIMDKLFSKDFKSINAEETKNKQVMIGSIQYFWKLIPNMKWSIREILQDNNRIIVRSRATGNPVGNFFGVQCNGSKSFDIMTIDIHTVEDNQITTIYHEEEWILAIKQLSSKQSIHQ